ncbi:MAG: fibronectin type III domain-containing protein [Planctomycetota bacterium]
MIGTGRLTLRLPAWFWLASWGFTLVTGVIQDARAQEAEVLPAVAIRRSIVELPASELPPDGKAAFLVQATEQDLGSEIRLRFEAIIPFAQEAGYASSARIAVNGNVLDASHFPVNWAQGRTWSIPALRPDPIALFAPGPKTWTVRYDCDRWPPVEESLYHSPEMAARYVYMFPIGKLLKVGENRIEIENTSSQYKLELFSCEIRGAAENDSGIENVRSERVTDTSVELAWDAGRLRYEVDYRPRGEQDWQTVPNVLSWEDPYTLIMLEPNTDYECRVRGLPQSVADLEGKVIPSEAAESSVIVVKTKSEPEPGDFAGFRLFPTGHVPGGLTTYPCVESHGGLLWLVDGSLNLIQLDPGTGKLVSASERPLASWPMPPPRGYMGIPDTTILDGKLWVTYNCQATGNPEGYEINQSRQFLLSYDLATGEVSDPVAVEPLEPEYGSWEGGVEAWRGKLWVMHMDVWKEGPVRRTRVVLRTFADGRFGEPVVYENCPTVYPYGPSISVFDDKLILLFSDLAACENDSNQEPLLYSLFDGKTFSEAKVLQDVGRSRYAKGVQVGDRFLCAYKCSAPYYEKFGYQYHDIALSLFTPGTDEAVRTTMYVDDRKYNSSPDVARHGDRIFVVYNKFEHLYGQRDNPAVSYGDFIGSLVPAEGDSHK